MTRSAQFLYRALTIVLVAAAVLIGIGPQQPVLAKSITPEVAAEQIQQANSPQEAGNKIRQQAQDYKPELRDDANYTKHAAKTAVQGTKTWLEQAGDTLQEKLNFGKSEKSRESGDRD